MPDVPRSDPRRSQRGSALVLAILITVILALLGISFLFLAQTENQIAQNDKLANQALYVAEAGARTVKRWFDRPGTALHFPDPAVVDRTLRQILDEADPYGPPVGTTPQYKENVDLDTDGTDDLLRRPYRGSALHALLGTRDGPDLRIDDADAAGGPFLEALSTTLFADFPGEGGGLVARVSRIELFAPPYVRQGGGWSRFGLATVRVVGRIYRPTPEGREIFAERAVEAVVSEVPYQGPHGPLHSCGNTVWTGGMKVRWGTLSTVGSTRFTQPIPGVDIPLSLPRAIPAAPRMDPLWNTSDPAVLSAFKTAIEGLPIQDPWFRSLSGESLVGAAAGDLQPIRPDDPPTGADHSGLLQLQPLVVCPPYDYELWSTIASSGERGVHFYAWDGVAFREDGVGAPQGFEAITDGAEGLFFFDTADGLAPTDADGDGTLDNLTPPIELSGTSWNFRGMLYLNAESFRVDGVTGAPTTLRAPGEPFQDLDQDGEHDAGEGWINLAYPTTAATVRQAPIADATSPGIPVRDARGPAVPGVSVSFHGILYNSGRFEATGTGTFYGSVIARQGVTQDPDDGSAPTPEIFWDDSIRSDWPPAGWSLPRAMITSWNLER